MDIRKLQKIVVAALEDIKAEDIEVINTTKLTSLFDRIVVASGNSNRQVKSLARNVRDKVAEAGGEVLGVEGEDAGEWVLVDLGSMVVHVMQPAVRSYYNLEELWQTAPKRPAAAEAVATPPVRRARVGATTVSATAATPAAKPRRASRSPAQ